MDLKILYFGNCEFDNKRIVKQEPTPNSLFTVINQPYFLAIA